MLFVQFFTIISPSTSVLLLDVVLTPFIRILANLSLMRSCLLYRCCFDFLQRIVLNHLSFDFISSFSSRDFLDSISLTVIDYFVFWFVSCLSRSSSSASSSRFQLSLCADLAYPLGRLLGGRGHRDVSPTIIVNWLSFTLVLSSRYCLNCVSPSFL